MSIADTLPVPTAVTALVRLPFLDRDALHDFAAMQAFRSVCHAVSSSKGHRCASSSDNQALPAAAGKAEQESEGFAVLRLLSMRALESFEARRVAAYVSSELLVESGSEFGAGNDRPRCQDEWIELLREGAARATSTGAVDRRFQCGYVMLLGDTLVQLRRTITSHGSMPHLANEHGGESPFSRFSSLLSKLVDGLFFPSTDCPNLGKRACESVVYHCGILAEGTKRDAQENSASTSGGGPSFLSGAANDCVLTIFSISAEWIQRCNDDEGKQTEDGLPEPTLFHSQPQDLYTKKSKKGKSGAVAEIVSGFGIWPAMSTLQRCIVRSLHWTSMRSNQTSTTESDLPEKLALTDANIVKSERNNMLTSEAANGVDRLFTSLMKTWGDTPRLRSVANASETRASRKNGLPLRRPERSLLVECAMLFHRSPQRH